MASPSLSVGPQPQTQPRREAAVALASRTWKPSLGLAPFIRTFSFRHATLGTARIYNPLPARSDSFLEFYLKDRYRIVDVISGAIHHAPRTVLVGPHSVRREDLLYAGHLQVFTIHFTPIGFRALFGTPAHVIGNVAESAAHVVGSSIGELEDHLAVAPPDALAGIAERFLFRHLLERRRTEAALPRIALTAARIAETLKHRPNTSVAALAAHHELSPRQVERLFQEYIGVAPKTFSRIARLGLALQLSPPGSNADWAGIAHTAGYFDQSHMVRDFRDLTRETPARFAALRWRAAGFTMAPAEDVAFVLSSTTASA